MTNLVWDKIASVIEKDAPIAASMLSSVSPGASLLVTLLGHAFGAANVDPSLLPTMIATDPDSAVKLAAIDRQLAQVDSSDRQGARLARPVNDWIVSTLAMVFVFGFFVFIALSVSKYIPDTASTHQIFDMLSNAVMVILAYFYGSCHPNNR